MATETKPKRGRRPVHNTPEEKAAAKKKWRTASKAKTKNVTLDNDVQEMLVSAQDRFEEKFKFRPTLSQVLRHVLSAHINAD